MSCQCRKHPGVGGGGYTRESQNRSETFGLEFRLLLLLAVNFEKDINGLSPPPLFFSIWPNVYNTTSPSLPHSI